jgi:starch-binding outer membrane protein, SusD/RagB family
MKNIKYLLIIFIAFNTACHDLLDQEPLVDFAPENYFSSEAEILTGVNATYDPLTSGGGRNTLYHAGLPLLLDFLSDDAQFNGGGNFGEAERIDLTSNNGFVERAYVGFYEMVSRANLMLDNIPNVPMAEERRNRYTAEVRFLRAFANFHLSLFWGEVPLRTKTITVFEEAPMGGAPLSDFHALIDQDLQYAVEHLPWTYAPQNYGRASKGAALALWAKSYMVRKDWNAALALTTRIINDPNSPHELINSYRDVFEVAFKNHPEHIFSARSAGGLEPLNEGAVLELRYGPPANQVPPGFLPGPSNSIARPSFWNGTQTNIRNGLINTYLDNKDPRLEQGYVNFRDGNPLQWYSDKFRDTSPHVANNASSIFPLIRYADVLLMHAEILNEVNKAPTPEAYNVVNQVRRRANNKAPATKILKDISGLDYNSFKEAVYLERRLELSHEGHRWIDLVRTGRMTQVMGAHLGRVISEEKNIFPIPNRELDANSELKQNTGF